MQQQQLGLGLKDVNSILVKFSFTNQSHVPMGIPQKEREDNGHMDGRRMAAHMSAGKLDPKYTLGRHRPGRVDSGKPVFEKMFGRQGVPEVRAHVLRGDLVRAGFVLTDAHWYVQPSREAGKMPKCVVVLCYERNGDQTKLPRGASGAVAELCDTTWAYGHVWDNGPDEAATVNLVGYKSGQDFRNALAVKDGLLTVRAKSENLHRHEPRGEYRKASVK